MDWVPLGGAAIGSASETRARLTCSDPSGAAPRFLSLCAPDRSGVVRGGTSQIEGGREQERLGYLAAVSILGFRRQRVSIWGARTKTPALVPTAYVSIKGASVKLLATRWTLKERG